MIIHIPPAEILDNALLRDRALYAHAVQSATYQAAARP